MQLPTDPNHLLGRKSLSLTLGCQHLPVDTSLSPLFFFSLSLSLRHPADVWQRMLSSKAAVIFQATSVFLEYVNVTESYKAVS